MDDLGLVVEAIYDDPDLIELYVGASNGAFRGQTSVYGGVDEVKQWASALAGFPRSVGDRRSVALGGSSSHPSLGKATLEFVCLNGLGHAGVWVELTSADRDQVRPGQTVRLLITFDAADIDRFVDELRSIGRTKQGVARIRGGPTKG